MKLLKDQEIKTQVNWDTPQWVQHIKDPNIVVLLDVHGPNSISNFCGTILPCDSYKEGMYRKDLIKNSFKTLQTNILFTISNEN